MPEDGTRADRELDALRCEIARLRAQLATADKPRGAAAAPPPGGERRLALALGHAAMIGLWNWDLDSGLIHADADFARAYGVDPARAVAGAPLEDFTRRFHPDDLPPFAAAVAATLETGAPFAQEYRILAGDGSVRWLLARGGLVRDGTGRPVRFPGASIDITDRKLAEERQAALVELSDRFRDVADTADVTGIAAEVLGRTLRLTRAGYGSVDATGCFIAVERDWVAAGSTSVAGHHRFADYGSFVGDLLAGRTVVIDDVEADPRTSGDLPRLRALGVRALFNVPVMEQGQLVAVLFLHDRVVRHWSPAKVDFVRDVAQRTREAVARRRAEDRQRLLAGELEHRVKNMLAMVQAIAAQTFRHTATPEAQRAFADRMVALARANDILIRAGWTAAAVADVVRAATLAHADGRFDIAGPPIEIAAQASIAITLALHELCTNAAKYGALSVESGRVSIAWAVDADGLFTLDWAEAGGPPVTPPTRQGFGTRLLERSLGGQLGGSVAIDHPPTGVTCRFRVPLAAIQQATPID